MITKLFEIRDACTFIPALAVKLNPTCEADRYLFGRAGFGITAGAQAEYVYLIKIDGGDGAARTDPYAWPVPSRTMQIAHEYIIKHFNELETGAVVDVEFILGKTKEPKKSERPESPKDNVQYCGSPHAGSSNCPYCP